MMEQEGAKGIYDKCSCGCDTFRMITMTETFTLIAICTKCGIKKVL